MTTIGNIQLPIPGLTKIGTDIAILDILFDLKIEGGPEVIRQMVKKNKSSLLFVQKIVPKVSALWIQHPPENWKIHKTEKYLMFIANTPEEILNYFVAEKSIMGYFAKGPEVQAINSIIDFTRSQIATFKARRLYQSNMSHT